MVKKPHPAPIPQRNGYRLHFSYDGKQYRRFFIRDKAHAYIFQNMINMRLLQFKTGLTAPSAGVSLPDFIFSNIVPPEEEELDEVVSSEENLISHPVTHLVQLIAAFQKYSQSSGKAASTVRTEKFHLNHLKEYLKENNYGDPLLESINPGFFNAYKNYRSSQKAKGDTVNKELSTFQIMFQYALDGGYIKSNILKMVKKEKKGTHKGMFHTTAEVEKMLRSGHYDSNEAKALKRFRYLTEAEIKELIALAEGDWLHPILIVFACTGIRRGELINLDWTDVNLEVGTLQVYSKKQSKTQREVSRSIEMHSTLIAALTRQQKITGESRYVFVGANGERLTTDCLRHSFRKLIEGTKFEGVGFHVFRHSLASNLAARGVDQRVIDKILGHQTQEMRERYQHLFPALQKKAIDALDL